MTRSDSRPSYFLFACTTLCLVAFAQPSTAAYQYEKFVGEYLGEGITSEGEDLTKRDLRVVIKPKHESFVLTWVSVTHKNDGSLKRKSYTVQFKPKGNGLYGSAMRTDMFGNEVPLDPLKGEPYVWARISGDTLFVYAMLITEEGGYEMQVYERKLTPNGMDLTYYRVRDGGVTRTVRGTLKRID
ncbi:MAG: hypothetical protein R3337_11390 [Gammaproteobacteria bacterium]|nr:hypothetical protein [Gammaproteobacteria bacterium]